MPQLSVMFKTVSSDCNLDCGYCYYRESLYGGRGSGSPRHRISAAMLERFIPEYMEYVADAHVASFSWQGGEPTLAGLPFFERVVALQAAHARPPMAISNALQTNATLIDDAWAAFLKTYDFLVGVSVDGPREVHDAARRDARGRGSFDRVMAGVARLGRAGVAVNALCVVGPHNVERPGELMRFYRAEGFSHVQFIPCMDFQAMDPGRPPAYTITPAQYGAFLVGLFDAWYCDGRPMVSVRTFDNLLQSYVGVPNELCVHAERCDASLIVEHNGDVYPCDFYVDSPWRLGSVMETPLREIVASPARAAFVRHKRPLPRPCQECEWLAVCKSGCPRNRTPRPDGTASPDYFCESYRMLFRHADGRFRHLRERIACRQRYLEAVGRLQVAAPVTGTARGEGRCPAAQPVRRQVAVGRNDPCPCGSGRKHKACCGSPAESQSYLFQPPPAVFA